MGRIVRIDTLHDGDRTKCSANFFGVRIVVWFLGCDVRCDGCHNSKFWDFDNESFPVFSEEHLQLIKNEMDTHLNIYSGLSILGGEPFSVRNIDDVIKLCLFFKKEYSDKNICIWSGHTYDWLMSQEGEYGEKIKKVFELCDFLIDGPYIKSRRNISLKFRGSDNQHIIDLKTREVIE